MHSTTVLINELEQERRSLASSGRLHWFHWAVIVSSALLTLIAWQFSKAQIEESVRTQFERESSQIVELVTERMLRYEDALLSGVAAIEASGGEMSRAQWRAFAASLHIEAKYPGINGIGVIQRYSPGELQRHVAEQRLTRPHYEVHPRHSGGDHWPIVYIEPELPNAKAIGLDIAHEANRYTAAAKARDKGVAQITGPIVLIQDEGHTPGFLFYTPYYVNHNHASIDERRANFSGLIYAPFVVKQLMAGTLDQEKRRVGIRLSDNTEILYDENTPAESEFDADPLYREEVELDLYGRTWKFDIQSTTSFRAATVNNQPRFILMGGIAIEGLLLTMFLMLSRASRRTLSFADKMNAELRSKAAALSRSNSELESFAYVASHDLKTPLRGISDLAEYLREDLQSYVSGPEANPDVQKNLQRLQQQTNRMDNLINGIMSYSSVGARVEMAEELDVAELLASILAELNIRPDQLIVEGKLPILDTYRTRFEQVMNNLISNAFKYNPNAGEATVTVACRSDADFFQFSVSDNGPGIDPKFHSRIFEVFQTLQPKDEIESTGVGLSIVKKSVEALGGGIRVSSTPGQGTTFTFDWPRDVALQQPKLYGVG